MSDDDNDMMDENDMAAAMEEQQVEESAPASDDAENIAFEEIAEDTLPGDERVEKDLTAIYEIPVQISAVLGRSTMQVSQLLKLGRGAVVELDRRVGEAIDIYVNNRLVARGEVVVVEDKLGITMTEIVKSERQQ